MGEGRADTHAQSKLNAVTASLAFLLIFTGAICLMVAVNLKEDPPTPKVSWWQRSIIYHVYMPSFKDSNGDGFGDLNGVTDKLQHIKDIGASSVWLSPFFLFKPDNSTEAKNTDMGYDVLNHVQVDPLFGIMDDFDALSKKATELGLYLIIDFIPNHMNSESVEFKDSIANATGEYGDWFVWKNASNVGDKDYEQDPLPPNNWKSQTGQSAWEWNEGRKQFYLHHGLPSMPDLNLRNKDVKKHLNNILEFWLNKGVHGFRLGALNLLIEDFREPDLIHSDIRKTMELMEEWTAKLKEHEVDNFHRLLMVELVHDPDRVVDGDNHYQNFTYDVVDNPFGFHSLFGDNMNQPTGVSVSKAVKEYMESIPEESWPNWVIHTHDLKGRETIPPRMKETLMIMAMTLPGTCINYYGDEIGMSRNEEINYTDTQDAYARMPYANATTDPSYRDISRDPSRTPMQWNGKKNAGFTDGTQDPWLPVNPEFSESNITVEFQKNANHSAYLTFTKLAQLRNEVAFYYGDTFFPYQDENAFCFIRKSSTEQVAYLIAINFNNAVDHAFVKIDFTSLFPEFPTSGEIIVSDSSNIDVHVPGEEILLEDFELYAFEAIVIKIDFSDQDSLDEE